MKAKIISVKHYYAKTEDGEVFDVNIDLNDGLIKRVIDTGNFIEGEVIINEEQDRYDDGTYAKSYTETKVFIPHIKISLNEEQTKKSERVIPNVPKEERYNEDRIIIDGKNGNKNFKTKGFWKKPDVFKEGKITLSDVDPNKVKLMNEGTKPKHIKLKKD